MPSARPEKPFLVADWKHLVLATYDVSAAIVSPLLPPGCELDLRDGAAFVSLVAFDFLETRVKGIKWPGFTNFPEINLRTYVRCEGRRGVVFVRELVPSRLIAWCARWLYNEPYRRAPMSSRVARESGMVTISHSFSVAGTANRIEVVADDTPKTTAEDSEEHFFKEHEHGFGASRRGERLEYRVEHPVWRTYPVRSHEISVDFAKVYGEEWAPLSERQPMSVIAAEGSAIKVFPPGG